MIHNISKLIGNKEERIRIMFMGGILLCAALMTFWFHGLSGSDEVLAHLFLVPIIMASIWWQKNGLYVAVSLGAILIISHLYHNMFILTYDDYSHVAVFILVAYVVAIMSKKTSRSKGALRESEEKYRNLFHNAQVGVVWIVPEDGRVVDTNRRLAEMFGYASMREFKEKHIVTEHYVDPGVHAQFLAKVEKDGRLENFEARHRRLDGEIIWLRYSGRLNSRMNLLELVVVDVTEEKLAEMALRESEEKYRNLFDNAYVGIARASIRGGTILEANRKAAEILGYENVVDLQGRSLIFEVYADKGNCEALLAEIFRNGKIEDFETRITRKDGEIIWIRYSGRAYPEQGYIEGVILEITAEKAARDELLESEEALKGINRQLLEEGKKRRYLSGRLIDLLERDRKRISMDLHDQVGQDLTTLKIDLEILLRKLGPKEAALSGKINAARDKAVKAIRDIKEISSGLRPSVLDHLGLAPALKELCDIMNQQAIVHIDFFCPEKIYDLDSAIEVALYRIVQEGLTNMLKHSGAQKGFVTLIEKGEMITLSVEDDGVGIPKRDDDGFNTLSKGMGLLIMEERAVYLGGSFLVDSSGGGGTTLLAEIPGKWGAPKNNSPDIFHAPLGREAG